MKYLNNEGRPKRYKQYSDGKYKSSLCYSVFYRNRSIYPIEDCSNQKDRQCFQDVQKIKSRINSGYNRINSDACSVENQVTDVFGDNIAFSGTWRCAKQSYCFSTASAAFHKVLRSAYSCGAFAGSRISLWTIPRFSG